MDFKRKKGMSAGGFPASQTKKKKSDWDDDGPSQFEEELAFLDEVEADMALEMNEARSDADMLPVGR